MRFTRFKYRVPLLGDANSVHDRDDDFVRDIRLDEDGRLLFLGKLLLDARRCSVSCT